MVLKILVAIFLDLTVSLVRDYVEMSETVGDCFIALCIAKIKVSNFPLFQRTKIHLFTAPYSNIFFVYDLALLRQTEINVSQVVLWCEVKLEMNSLYLEHNFLLYTVQ